MESEKFKDYILTEIKEDYGICPPPMDAQKSLDILIDHFLGKDWYGLSISQEQVNTEAVYQILKNNPKPMKITISARLNKFISKIKNK